MGSTSKYGRATINATAPRAVGICDRCGFLFDLNALRFQFDWAGTAMVNRHLRVCSTCYDRPQEQLRAIVLPPDPPPVNQPRPENFDVDEYSDLTIRPPIGNDFMFAGRAVVSAELFVLIFPLQPSISGAANVIATLKSDFHQQPLISGAANVIVTLTSAASLTREITDAFAYTLDASPVTDTGTSIGTATADRLIFVALSGLKTTNSAITSVTVGGVSATAAAQVRRANGGGSVDFCEIWWAAVPTGTTGTVVITEAGEVFNFVSAEIYKVTGANTTIPVNNSDTGSVASGNVTTDVTIGDGQVSLACAMVGVSTASAATTFTNITEDAEYSIDIGAFVNGGFASRAAGIGPGAVTFTASTSADDIDANKVMASVVIQPA